MTYYLGNNIIAGLSTNKVTSGFNVFDVKWSDHIINDIQWLRADTFSWQDGNVYTTAYNKLVEEWNSVDARVIYYAWENRVGDLVYTTELYTPSDVYDIDGNIIDSSRSSNTGWDTSGFITENHGAVVRSADNDVISSGYEIEGSITFKRSANGFKIADATQEQAILNKYNTDGIAWYYILDIENKRFKLPRTKWGFKGLRTEAGNGIGESLPNITGSTTLHAGEQANIIYNTDGALGGSGGSTTQYRTAGSLAVNSGAHSYGSLNFDASRSSSAYKDNAPVQERGTQMYLYFYVGEYTKTAIEQSAGITSEQLNNKLDIDTIHVIETFVDGTSGYRIWSDGYCEQWGVVDIGDFSGYKSITLLKKYIDTEFKVSTTCIKTNDKYCGVITSGYSIVSNTVLQVGNRYYSASDGATTYVSWQASGYLAEGQY